MKTFIQLLILWILLFSSSVILNSLNPVSGEMKNEIKNPSFHTKVLLEVPLDPSELSFSNWKELPGIGPKLAGRIMKFQKYYGPMKDFSDLQKIYGISPKTLFGLKPYFASKS